MMISPKCMRCHQELEQYGGLLLSPPSITPSGPKRDIQKDHLCVQCYWFVYDQIATKQVDRISLELNGYQAGNLLALFRAIMDNNDWKYNNGDWFGEIPQLLEEIIRANPEFKKTLSSNFPVKSKG